MPDSPRLVKRAMPPTAFAVTVPTSTPPVDTEAVTDTVEFATVLPAASCTTRTGCVSSAAPDATASLPSVTKSSCAGAPSSDTTGCVMLASPLALKVSVYSVPIVPPTTSSSNAATPDASVIAVAPATVAPAEMVAVTVTPESDTGLLPVSTKRTVGAVATTAPAAAPSMYCTLTNLAAGPVATFTDLVATGRPSTSKVSVYVLPFTPLTVRSPKVATPLTALTDVVPPSDAPVDTEAVTVAVEPVTVLPPASTTATVAGLVNATPERATTVAPSSTPVVAPLNSTAAGLPASTLMSS